MLCFLRNINDVVNNGKTAYQLRHESDFCGKRLPFGCAVHYKPSAHREVDDIQKFEARTRTGILVGYHLHSGGKWSGDYLVVDAAMYNDHAEEFMPHAHRVKEIIVDGKITFPVQNLNNTALPTDKQESESALGDRAHDDSLNETKWDLQPDTGARAASDGGDDQDREGVVKFPWRRRRR